MDPGELLKAFLQVPELLTVGSAQERAAFIAIRIEKRTVREAAEAIGVSKSQVTNLADLFQMKLATKVMELRTGSEEFRALYKDLRERLYELQEESGSDRFWYEHKVGSFKPGDMSREDRAEAMGMPLINTDEW
jgi:hypothetical protein